MYIEFALSTGYDFTMGTLRYFNSIKIGPYYNKLLLQHDPSKSTSIRQK